MDSKNNDAYMNEAHLDENSPLEDCTDYECCGEVLAFAMKDNHHTFSIGLSTVLKCLAIAEQEGYVPKLPGMWWLMVKEY